MKLDRVMIAAPKSGSGKTTITCAILQILREQGEKVVSYKCGPDYIDPMFHQQVIGIPSKNLDTFFTGEDRTEELFLRDRTEGEFAVLEGVMGLYDGLGGIREEGSSYHLAKVTKSPILLVVDAKGMGRSVTALIAGFLQYDTQKLIRGVILNRISPAYYETICPLIEKELPVCVVGFVPDLKELQLKSRHLGLVLPEEQEDVKKQLKDLAAALQKTVSMDKVRKIAESAEELPGEYGYRDRMFLNCKACEEPGDQMTGRQQKIGQQTEDQQERNALTATETENREVEPVIAVAKDEAFCFYYEDNLRLLEAYGARLKYFSPLRDSALPRECDGILLGGGYPELHLKELEQNEAMRSAIRLALDAGVPCVAECGGFMYLHETIEDPEGRIYRMAGALSENCKYKGKLVRFGYIELQEKEARFLPEGESIRGHEFHYYDSDRNGEDCVAMKPVTGRNYSCVTETENRFLGFPHLYYPSNPSFARSFVDKARRYHKEER